VSAGVVEFAQRGQRLAITSPLTPAITEIVERALTYQKMRFLRGAEARAQNRKVVFTTVPCFRVVPDPDGILPPTLLTLAGFFPRLQKALTARGFRVRLTDNTPPPTPPEAYTPRWDRLQGVAWKYRQEECVRAIAANQRGRIRAPTGLGKSFIIAKLARLYPRARFLVTTYSVDVLRDLYNAIDEELEGTNVGLLTGSSKRDLGRNPRVLCVSAGSLGHVPDDRDILLIDEVHEFATDVRLRFLSRFQRARVYAFSANKPGDRTDNADFELEGVCGPLIFDMEYTEAVEHDAVVQLKVMMCDVVTDLNPVAGMTEDYAVERHGIWRNSERNGTIARVARYWASQGKQVLITVSTTEHACFLKKRLPEFTLVYDQLSSKDRDQYIRWGLIPPDEPEMTSRRRMLLKEDFESGALQTAIATTVWNRGVNFLQLQVLVRADGKSSPIASTQVPGRLSRLSADKPYGVLVDFNDQFDTRLERRASARRNYYRKMGWDLLVPPPRPRLPLLK
jgi:superfamily II DNA or RNA helicase